MPSKSRRKRGFRVAGCTVGGIGPNFFGGQVPSEGGVSAILKSGSAKIKSGSAKIEIGTATGKRTKDTDKEVIDSLHLTESVFGLKKAMEAVIDTAMRKTATDGDTPPASKLTAAA